MNNTTEKKNITCREMTKEILEYEVYKELESIQNNSLVYPAYYLKLFHPYDEENLTSLAAAEAEPTTMSMAMRAIPEASSADEANEIMCENWICAIEQHHIAYLGTSTVFDILDIRCYGLNLSPYFLNVAQYKAKRGVPRKYPIRWIHANSEDTGLLAKSFDIVSISYVFHECPTRAIVNIVNEAFRLLRPGGTLALIDNLPKSKILRELSPVLFTLMKRTKPFLDEYYLTDVEETMRKVDFVNIKSLLTYPRHITTTATVPQ
ncbi:uncharacterized protein LOC130965758 [Arachis stenosperma]|uniref:uncharacterized protein LOC130965758 n=1 Tax=Arachis stenosperma TaxID=217475 RepID=UPI0025AD0AE2|nr:uncharacterized protein LOC130965758 [Arachis stenosperma]